MRWVRRILIGLLVLMVILAGFAVFLVRRSFPRAQGELVATGLTAPVEVVRDVDGVPHLYAETTHDLYFAQGFVHAQDRFWQMDFWRHIGAGRLSEMFGEGQVETDAFLRSLGLAELAEAELEALEPSVREILQAYADGVNAYVAERSPTQLSLEYAILPLQSPGYEIEPWTPVNTLTWAKVMAWDLDGNLRSEIDRAVLTRSLPVERVEQLYPPYPERHPVVVPSDQVTTAALSPTTLPDDAIYALRSTRDGANRLWGLTGGGFEGIGSNNWALGGSLTESGMPLLANDPHLAIQMPSIWYQIGLHCTGEAGCVQDAVGFSFAGTPGVIVGHNEHIAWGVTTENVDTQDLFVERVNPGNPNQYEVEGQWVDFDTRAETIRVAGGDDVTLKVQNSRHGPVISETFLEEGELDETGVDPGDPYVVALSWGALQPSTLVNAILGINQATNYEEFRTAASMWDIAAQNLVYADTSGNIAYQSTGRVPLRATGDGRYPVPGWDSENEWVGYVPFEEMPRLLNPPRDYVASANQSVTRPGAGPFATFDAAYGYRANRIGSLIEGQEGHTVASMQATQMDAEDGGASIVVPYLAQLSGSDEATGELLAILTNWASSGHQASGESPGAAVYQATWRHLLALTFHDDLPEEHWPEGGGRWFEVIRELLDRPEDPYWDDIRTETIESRDDILARAVADAGEELRAILGEDSASWSWGELHAASFENQTLGQSGIGPVEWLFNRTAPARVGGSEALVNAVGWNPIESYQVDWIPSFRMVVDLADLSRSTMINATGPSGHAFHRHYDNMIEDWTDGAQRPMRWTREQVTAEGATILTLVP